MRITVSTVLAYSQNFFRKIWENHAESPGFRCNGAQLCVFGSGVALPDEMRPNGLIIHVWKSLFQSKQKECTMLEYRGPLNVNGKVLVKQPKEIMKWETPLLSWWYEIYGGAIKSIWSTWNSSQLTKRMFFFFSSNFFITTTEMFFLNLESGTLQTNHCFCGSGSWAWNYFIKVQPTHLWVINGCWIKEPSQDSQWRSLKTIGISLKVFSLFLQLFFFFKVRVMLWLLGVCQPIES